MGLLRGFPLVLLAIGLAARVSPLFDLHGRNLRQFTTEDGYLMLTIARNLALGRGMSIADGTIPTNGTQPLLSFVYAGGFWLVGGDKEWGVWIAQAIQIAIALAAAFALYGFGRRLLAGRPDADRIAAVAAALWFASARVVAHGQNGLETGGYALVLLLVAIALLRMPPGEAPWPLRRCAALGALLGVAFWTRNDASLVIAAVCAARVLPVLTRGFASIWQRGLESFAIGATSVLVASPWLLHNKLHFGHWRPISGIAQAASYSFGENLPQVPVVLAEYLLVTLPVPMSLEKHPLILLGSLAVCAAGLAGGIALARELAPAARRCVAILGLALAAFVAFYGLTFGVGFFLSRYFFPFSPFLALLGVTWAWRLLAGHAPRGALPAAAAVALVLVAALDVRLYRRGLTHQGHFQVVEWVQENVPPEVWVGAIQTGTLGFFHDRTINLDGKVNPRALEARLAGRTQEYVLETRIQYLVDWVGIESWLDLPAFRDRFELLVGDPDRNLVVLRREPAGPG
jgi:hypothetical protein